MTEETAPPKEEQEFNAELEQAEKDRKRKLSPEETKLVKKIGDELGETLSGPRHTIWNIIAICGAEFAEAMYKETMEIEAKGGLMTEDGTRRRTTGGVFFYLAKGRMSDAKRRVVFPYRGKYARKASVRLAWDKRIEIQDRLREKKRGEIQEMRVTIIGYPGEYEKRNDCIVTMMEHTAGGSSLPTGVPEPPEEETIYTVYIAEKQWKKVRGQLKDDKNLLVVEGIGRYDPEIPGIAVLATGVKIRKVKKKEAEGESATEKQTAPKQSKPAKPPESKPKPAKKTRPSEQILEAPERKPIEMTIPEGASPEVEKKLQELYAAAQQFRDKIAALEAKPENQRFGLGMTEKLLANVERQINDILEEHKT